MSFWIVCVDSDNEGIAAQACGPFETLFEAKAELSIIQNRALERCNLDHVIAPEHKVPTHIGVYRPKTSELERRQWLAREAATRSAR